LGLLIIASVGSNHEKAGLLGICCLSEVIEGAFMG